MRYVSIDLTGKTPEGGIENLVRSLQTSEISIQKRRGAYNISFEGSHLEKARVKIGKDRRTLHFTCDDGDDSELACLYAGKVAESLVRRGIEFAVSYPASIRDKTKLEGGGWKI